jgi:hypothetical protein
MTPTQYPRSGGQHRRRLGQNALQHVETLWQYLHPGVDPKPVEDLGFRPHCPRHAAGPKRRRVYL